MASSVHINESLALRVHRHTGNIGPSEFRSLISAYQSNPRVFLFDVIQVVEDTAKFEFGLEELPVLKGDFRNLVEGAKLPLILRSAWVCLSPSAWGTLEAWLHERHSLDGLHTEAVLVAKLDEAAGLFDQDELSAVRSMIGFRHWFST